MVCFVVHRHAQVDGIAQCPFFRWVDRVSFGHLSLPALFVTDLLYGYLPRGASHPRRTETSPHLIFAPLLADAARPLTVFSMQGC